jgi:hypothetical protein
VGKKGENDSIAQAQGGIPPGAGQPRREKSGVPERWPGQLSSGRGRPGKLKIFLKHPLDWEKTRNNYIDP